MTKLVSITVFRPGKVSPPAEGFAWLLEQAMANPMPPKPEKNLKKCVSSV